MEERIQDLYKLPNITDYEDIHLQTLYESCAVMEERLGAVKERMSDYDRYILESYIDLRNDLEFQSIQTALRWEKQHYK